MLGGSQEIIFDLRLIGDSRCVAEENQPSFTLSLSRAIGWNSCPYGDRRGGNGHKEKVAENKGINPGVGSPCLGRQAPSKAIGEDTGFLDLCIQNVQVDDSVSQRTPPHHKWVKGWKR